MLNLLLTILGLGTLLGLLVYIGLQVYRTYNIFDLRRIKIFTAGLTIAGFCLDAALATVKPSIVHLAIATCFLLVFIVIMYKICVLERILFCESCRESEKE